MKYFHIMMFVDYYPISFDSRRNILNLLLFFRQLKNLETNRVSVPLSNIFCREYSKLLATSSLNIGTFALQHQVFILKWCRSRSAYWKHQISSRKTDLSNTGHVHLLFGISVPVTKTYHVLWKGFIAGKVWNIIQLILHTPEQPTGRSHVIMFMLLMNHLNNGSQIQEVHCLPLQTKSPFCWIGYCYQHLSNKIFLNSSDRSSFLGKKNSLDSKAEKARDEALLMELKKEKEMRFVTIIREFSQPKYLM